MKAALLQSYDSPLVFGDAPDPRIGADDVLLRVKVAGVCATDLKVMRGGFGVDPDRLPLIPGTK